MIQKNTALLKTNSIILLIICLFAIEIIATLNIHFSDVPKTRVVGIFKVFLQVVIVFFINYNNLNKKLVYLFIILSSIFLVNQILNPSLVLDFNWLVLQGSIYYFDRYIYIILFAIMFYSRIEKNIIGFKAIKIIEYILIINSILMFLGLVFNLKIFESYPWTTRFGYDGIFNKVNEVSFIYCIYLIYLYYKCIIEKTKHWMLFLFIAISSLLLGTKAILLFFSLLFFFHFIIIPKKSKLYKTVVISFIIIFVLFFEKIMRLLFNLFPFWDKLQEEYGLLTLLLSKRDILLNHAIGYVNENWTIINYLIGGPYYSKNFILSQMDGPDLFLFFGLLGTIIYGIICYNIFFKKNKIINGLTIIIIICGMLAGALLMSPVSMIFLFLVTFTLYNTEKQINLN